MNTKQIKQTNDIISLVAMVITEACHNNPNTKDWEDYVNRWCDTYNDVYDLPIDKEVREHIIDVLHASLRQL